MQPEVSVLMSCYNASRWLRESIESVLAQTYGQFEFILIDDGSSDDTLTIIRDYEKADSRINVIAKPNTGLTNSLNIGISQAKGLWIARLDADDLCAPNRLEEQLAFVKRNDDIVLLGSGFVEIDEYGKPLKEHRYPGDHKALVCNLERSKRFFPHSSAFINRSIIQKIGGYNSLFRRSQDRDLWLRLAEQGKLACLDKSLVQVRKHSSQISYISDCSSQVVYGISASVCHFLRRYGGPDPSVCQDGSEWRRFLAWVETRLDEEGVFEKRSVWTRLRQAYFTANNRFTGVLRLTAGLLGSKYAVTFLLEKITGSKLPEKLAREWSSNQCAAS